MSIEAPEQRLSGRKLLADGIRNFLFSISSGLGASAQAPGRRGTQLGMAAALGAPWLLAQQDEEKKQREEEFRLRAEQIRDAARRGQVQDALSTLNAVQGMPAESMQVSAPQATPMSYPGQAGQGPTMGGGQMSVMRPQRPVNIPGYGTVTPENSDQMGNRLVEETIRKARAEREINPPADTGFTLSRGQTRFDNSGNTLASVPPEVEPEPDYSPLISAIEKNPEAYWNITDGMREKILPALTEKGFKAPPKPTDPTLQAMREFQLAQLQAGSLTPIQFAQSQALSKDFNDETKDFVVKRRSYDTIATAANDPSAAGDLSIIFAYMKLLDPPSVVREGEQATAANAAGVPDRIRNIYNRALTGQRLAPMQRQDFINQAKKQYETALADYEEIEATYKQRAAAQKIPPEAVVRDLRSRKYEPNSGPSEALIQANMKANPGMSREQVIQELKK